MFKFKILIIFNLLLNVTLQQKIRLFGIDNKDNLNRHDRYRDINNLNSGKQGAFMGFESHNHIQSPSSNLKSESEKSDTLTKLLQLKDFNENSTRSAIKLSTSGKIRPTTLHELEISVFAKPSESEFTFLSKRNIDQNVEHDLLHEPIPKVNLVHTQDEKKQPDSNRNPEPNRKKKLEKVLKPRPDSYDKVESDHNDKTEPSPEQEPGLDLDKKQDPDPYQKIEPNLDKNTLTELNTAEKLETDSKTETEPNQRSGSDYRFWNPFTITIVTVATSVTVLVILVGAYHFGKVRARVNSSIVRDDIHPQIIIPRVRNFHQNPIHLNYV